MDSELLFRISLGLLLLLLFVIRLYYTLIAAKSGSSFSTSQLGRLWSLLLWFLYGFLIFLAIVYILTPSWLAWAALALPWDVRWFGAGVGLCSAVLLLWVHRILGKNFAKPGIIQARQTLVTTGPYRWVRHPIYTTFGLIGVALVALLFGGLLLPLTRIEEQTLIENFGKAYRAYMERTGRFVPRVEG